MVPSALFSSNNRQIVDNGGVRVFLFVNEKTEYHVLLTYFTFVYGSPRSVERRILWENLKDIGETVNNDWAVLGDFNSILEGNEKQGGGDVCWSSVQEFSNCLSGCHLLDIGCSGPKFSWKRGKLQERIDRLVVNDSWLLSYPHRSIYHLSFNRSDHRPLLLKDDSCTAIFKGPKPFRFLVAWLTDENFGEVVDACWNQTSDWVHAKDKFQREASLWHCNVFKELHRRKLKIQGRLRGLEAEMCRYHSEALERLHKSLW
ncbi:uncharacterized protein LOC133316136 [Gastrolobium bilobum]|uniref:uncharacterized protein LOC133316136 n=1 Tax=Gastrolobium bilobum TaxID=150636 RepID=UPI002AB225FA|nr:uncharacterized protein LOC133316136 [Gastrolobium bilobum]